jgi:3-dehydrosphinganine reductase
MTDVIGSHAIVTGGSSGIGRATARLLARKGARVSIVARDPTRLDTARAEIVGSVPGAVVQCAAADVTDPAAVEAALGALGEQAGPCDILVNAAGSAHPGYFDKLPLGVFRDQMEVNYFGTLHAVRAVVPAMIRRRRGHIVAISSTAGLFGVFGYAAYAPAKFAVRGLAETLRPELVPYGIVVACAYPPDTRTPGLDRENAFKPPETVSVAGRIQPRSADDVAVAIVRGIERDRLMITMDFQTAALARAADVFGPYARWTMDRTVRRVRGTFHSPEGQSREGG